MKKISTYFTCISIMLAVMIFSFLIAETYNVLNYRATSSNADYSNLSNKKVCWGIKRADNNEQPDVGKVNTELMEKYNGIFMGNKDKKIVYLTFDAGYEAGYTEKILEVLKDNNVTATFFITGHYLNSQPELIKKIIENGNIVGNQFPNNSMYLKMKMNKS